MQALPILLSRLKQIVTQASTAFFRLPLSLRLSHGNGNLQKSGRNKIVEIPPSKFVIHGKRKHLF